MDRNLFKLFKVLILNIYVILTFVNTSASLRNELVQGSDSNNLSILLLGSDGCQNSIVQSNLFFQIDESGITEIETNHGFVEYHYRSSDDKGVVFTDSPKFLNLNNNDGSILAAVDEYISTKTLPDIVFVCFLQSEGIMDEGSLSSVTKMLRALSLVQHKIGMNPKTILLLVQSTSTIDTDNTPAENDETTMKFHDIIKNTTLYPLLSTVVIRNEPGEPSEIGLNIEKLTNCRKLKSELSKIDLQSNKKKTADTFCAQKFLLSEKLNIVVNRSSSKTNYYSRQLQKLNLKVEDTPVSRKLVDTFHQLERNGNDEFTQALPFALEHLIQSLNTRFIIEEADFPTSPIWISSLVKELEVDANGLHLLEAAFGIKLPKLFTINSEFIQNYNQLLPKLKFPILASTGFTSNPQVGFQIPSQFNCELLPNNGIVSGVEYFHGYPVIHLKLPVVKCNLNTSITGNELSPELFARIQTLPGKISKDGSLNELDYTALVEWKEFFDKFGKNFTTELYFGGSITVEHNLTTESYEMMGSNILNHMQSVSILEDKNCILDIVGGGADVSGSCRAFFNNDFQIWLRSIQQAPTLLPNLSKFAKLDRLIQHIDMSAGVEITNALKFFDTNHATVEKILLAEIEKQKEILQNTVQSIGAGNNQKQKMAASLATAENELQALRLEVSKVKTNLESTRQDKNGCTSSLASCRQDLDKEITNARNLRNKLTESESQNMRIQNELNQCVIKKSMIESTQAVFTSITCEHSHASFSCAAGRVIHVSLAVYGRQDGTTCPSRHIRTHHCAAGNSMAIASRCNGQLTCNIHASNGVFGDPCVHTYKYLKVNYRCILA